MSSSYKDPKAKDPNAAETPGELPPVQINGFQQVLDMLRIADPAFRESLLRRLAGRDPRLADSLRRDLRQLER
jgi:hypothetical protein